MIIPSLGVEMVESRIVPSLGVEIVGSRMRINRNTVPSILGKLLSSINQ